MKKTALIALAASTALTACGGGSSGDPSLFFGTEGGTSANGARFAVAGDDYVNLEQTLKVKVVRALTDWETDTTRLVVSDEVLTITDQVNEYYTITLGGETITFDASGATVSANGNEWSEYIDSNTDGQVSATGTIYEYAYDNDPTISNEFDTEAFFVYGYETDPAEIAALTASVAYSGSLDGYGQLLDTNGSVLESEVSMSASVDLIADFTGGTVTGTVDGDNDFGGSDFVFDFTHDIVGNGYAGGGTMTCTDGCTDNGSILAGVFFGVDALETSGLMGLDVSYDALDDGSAPFEGRFISGAGFTAEQPSLP